MMAYTLSIDFGTSNTTAAVCPLGAPEQATMVKLSTASMEMPSGVLAYPDGRLVAGEVARSAARAMTAHAYEPTPKRRLGEGTMLLGEHVVDVVELVAIVLGTAARRAARHFDDTPPAALRLTHPAKWAASRLELLREAARRAGLPEPELVPEPVAAAAYYASRHQGLEEGASVLVYDLGGGTFDAAVLCRRASSPGGYEVLATEMIDPLGGELFDTALLALVRDALSERGEQALWERFEGPEAIGPRRTLLDELRRAKHVLSEEQWAEVPVQAGELGSSVSITRAEFEQLIMPGLLRSVGSARDALAVAGTKPQELSQLYLVGGSTYIPLVAELIVRELGVRPATFDDPKAVTALGGLHAVDRETADPDPMAFLADAGRPSSDVSDGAPPQGRSGSVGVPPGPDEEQPLDQEPAAMASSPAAPRGGPAVAGWPPPPDGAPPVAPPPGAPGTSGAAPAGRPRGLLPPVAGFGRRAGAAVIDGVLVYGGIWVPLSRMFGADGGRTNYLVMTACVLALAALFFAGFEGLRTQTPGKSLLGLRVLDASTGAPIGFIRGLGRWAARWVSAVPLGAGYLLMLFRPDHRTLHDLFMGMQVFSAKEPVEPIGSPPPPGPRFAAATVAAAVIGITAFTLGPTAMTYDRVLAASEASSDGEGDVDTVEQASAAVCDAWTEAAEASDPAVAQTALDRADATVLSVPVALRSEVRGDADEACGDARDQAFDIAAAAPPEGDGDGGGTPAAANACPEVRLEQDTQAVIDIRSGVVLSGVVTSVDEHDELVSSLPSGEGLAVNNLLSVAGDGPEPEAIKALADLLPTMLSTMADGHGMAAGTQVCLEGSYIDDIAAAELEAEVVELERAGAEVEVFVQQHPIDHGLHIVILQAAINRALGEQQIPFATASDELLPEADPILARVVEVMDRFSDFPDLVVTIEGHTDDEGDYDRNVQLSLDRARSVQAALIDMGVPEERLDAVGHGPDEPIASNSTASGRQENRRVVFNVGQDHSHGVPDVEDDDGSAKPQGQDEGDDDGGADDAGDHAGHDEP